jgi:proteasome accessory factor A
MQERIYGTEVEYAFQHFPTSAHPQRVFRGTEIYLFYLFRLALEQQGYRKLYEDKYNNFSIFLANGARLYVDRGSHPEYATAECRNWRDAVIQEKVGAQIIADLRPAIEKELQQIGYHGRLFIAKNNVDGAGSTYGSHENYLMERHASEETHAFFARLSRSLIPFLVTRQIFCGSGKVDPGNSGVGQEYQISQRADHIVAELSTNTASKGIINTKDEALAYDQRYRRLHLILGDSNMSDFSLSLKLGTTGIVLQLIEEGKIDPDIELEDPLLALRTISRDPTCKQRVRLRGGKQFTAIEIQEIYLEMAQQYFATRRPDTLVTEILYRWEDTLRLLADDPYRLCRRVDWIIKKWLLERQMQRERLTWSSPKIRQLDIKYHDIDPHEGLFSLLENNGLIERCIAPEEIEHAKHFPPQNTRAHVRHAFINAVLDHNLEGTVNWTSFSWGPNLCHSLEILDPFVSHSDIIANISP